MDQNDARQARMMAILDQAIAAADEAAQRALVSTTADTDEGRAFVQDQADLAAMEWHTAHPRIGENRDEILGCYITVEHPGHREMFVRGFETFELETGYRVYKELCLILAGGSVLRFFDKTVGGNIRCSVSGRRVDL